MLKNPPIKAILFDLDDTLLDGKTAQNKALNDFKESFQGLKQIEKAELEEKWREITLKHYDTYQKGIITFEESRIRRMKDLFLLIGEHISDEEAKERFKVYKSLYEKNWTAFNDVIDVLEKVKHSYKLAIVTNGDSVQQREKLDKIGITKYFDQITISSEVGSAKPDKEIFEVTCNKLHVKPEECVMIGDKFKVDVTGGRNLGMASIWANRKNEKIDYEMQIKNLTEIYNYIAV